MSDERIELENRIAFLERHLEGQDAEIWRLSQRVDALTARLREQDERLKSLAGQGGGTGEAGEGKPPHY